MSRGQTHGGKGSQQRETNSLTYNDNYDRIFCSKSATKVDEPPVEEVSDLDFGGSFWRPANGGLARPYEEGGKEYLLMYNIASGKEGIFNITDDKFETREDYFVKG